DRGHLALLLLLPLIFSLIGSVGLPVAMTYYIARTPDDARAVVTAALPAAALFAAAATIVHIAVLATILRDAPSRVQLGGAVSAALVPALLLQMYGQAILQGLRRFRAFNLVRLMPAALYALGVSAFFFTSAGTLPRVTFAWVVAMVIAGILALGTALRI